MQIHFRLRSWQSLTPQGPLIALLLKSLRNWKAWSPTGQCGEINRSNIHIASTSNIICTLERIPEPHSSIWFAWPSMGETPNTRSKASIPATIISASRLDPKFRWNAMITLRRSVKKTHFDIPWSSPRQPKSKGLEFLSFRLPERQSLRTIHWPSVWLSTKSSFWFNIQIEWRDRVKRHSLARTSLFAEASSGPSRLGPGHPCRFRCTP